jgi:flagellar hook assembly protein FlgD
MTDPGSFAINNPFPNPFNPTVTVEYTLRRSGLVEIQVYDAAGKLISEIFSGRQSEGKNVARWEAAAYPSGVYLIRVRTTDEMAMKKCLLLK